jgi:hypothetical protein
MSAVEMFVLIEIFYNNILYTILIHSAMQKLFYLTTLFALICNVSCDKGEEPNPNPEPGENTVNLTEDISYRIEYSVDGTDGLNRHFVGTLSLERPCSLSINHDLCDVGEVASVSEIETIPDQGWDTDYSCVAGHGYIARIVANDAHSDNPGTGVMYVRIYVADVELNSVGNAIGARIVVENAWRFEGFTPVSKPGGNDGNAAYKWTKKASVGAIVGGYDNRLYSVGDKLYLLNNNQLWLYDIATDKWNQKAYVPLDAVLEPIVATPEQAFEYVKDDKLYLCTRVLTKEYFASPIKDYSYTIWVYDETNDEWVVEYPNLLFGGIIGLSVHIPGERAFWRDGFIYLLHWNTYFKLDPASDGNGSVVQQSGVHNIYQNKGVMVGSKFYGSDWGILYELDTVSGNELLKINFKESAYYDAMFYLDSRIFIRWRGTSARTVKYDIEANTFEDVDDEMGWPYPTDGIRACTVVGDKFYAIFNETELWEMTAKVK